MRAARWRGPVGPGGDRHPAAQKWQWGPLERGPRWPSPAAHPERPGRTRPGGGSGDLPSGTGLTAPPAPAPAPTLLPSASSSPPPPAALVGAGSAASDPPGLVLQHPRQVRVAPSPRNRPADRVTVGPQLPAGTREEGGQEGTAPGRPLLSCHPPLLGSWLLICREACPPNNPHYPTWAPR